MRQPLNTAELAVAVYHITENFHIVQRTDCCICSLLDLQELLASFFHYYGLSLSASLLLYIIAVDGD